MKNNICIYIHWPWCRNVCNYCDYYKDKLLRNLKKNIVFNSYVRDLKVLKNYSFKKKVISINIGGGSPSVMDKNLLKKIIKYILDNFQISNDIEISIEVNPEDVTKERLREYKRIGINRICLGIQSFSNKELHFLGRQYGKEIAVNSVLQSSYFFDNIAIDLLYGIPGSSVRSFEKQLYLSRDLPVKHISLYEFDYNNIKKPLYVEDLNFFKRNKKILEEKKFIFYEINSFSKKNFQSRYNVSVLDMKSFFGIGPSSYSRIVHNNAIIKLRNTRNLGHWMNSVQDTFEKKKMRAKEVIEEFLLLGLYKTNGIKISELNKVTKGSLSSHISEKNIEKLKTGHFLCKKEGRLFLSTKGMLLINNIVSNILL